MPKPLPLSFLLPVGDPSTQVKFSLTYTITKTSGPNSGNTTALTTTISPSASPLWLPGKVLGYTILVIDDRLEIDGSVTVEDFGNGTDIGGGGIPLLNLMPQTKLQTESTPFSRYKYEKETISPFSSASADGGMHERKCRATSATLGCPGRASHCLRWNG